MISELQAKPRVGTESGLRPAGSAARSRYNATIWRQLMTAQRSQINSNGGRTNWSWSQLAPNSKLPALVWGARIYAALWQRRRRCCYRRRRCSCCCCCWRCCGGFRAHLNYEYYQMGQFEINKQTLRAWQYRQIELSLSQFLIELSFDSIVVQGTSPSRHGIGRRLISLMHLVIYAQLAAYIRFSVLIAFPCLPALPSFSFSLSF